MVRSSGFVGAAAAAFSASLIVCSPGAQAQGVVGEWAAVKPPPAPELKPVTVDPKTTALLVMDFSQGNCRPDRRARCVAAIPHEKSLIDRARAASVLIVYTFTPNMKPGDFVQAIAPQPGDPSVIAGPNKFKGTDLDRILKDHGIKTLIATGTAPNGAVLFTAFEATSLGYQVVIPVDTMPGDTAYAEQSTIFSLDHTLGPIKRIMTSSEMISF